MPIGIVFPGVKHAHDADVAHGGSIRGQDFAAEEPFDFPVNKARVLFLAASKTFEAEFATVTADEFVAGGKAMQRQCAAVGATTATKFALDNIGGVKKLV